MFKSVKKWLLPLVSIIILIAIFTGCSSNTTTTTSSVSTTAVSTSALSGSFKIIGSNTVTPLSSIWAENFMNDNPKVSIAVSGPGSGAGIAALIDGTTDVCQASRKIKGSEVTTANEKGVFPYEIQVATDALSVVVNPVNPVSELTFVQLSAIYTGQITNWKEVGGNDAAIVAIGRDTNSGTFAYFLEEVVQMAGMETADKTLQYGGKVLMLPSTEEGISQVAGNANAIFYGGLGYLDESVKAVGIKKTADDNAVLPNLENALNGTYPISRALYYYTNGEPTGVIKSYIDYCLSGEGQEIVEQIGFVPLN